MFLVVDGHRGVLHERVVAVGPRAVEMPIDFVARAVRQSAVDVTIVELESVQDVDVVVEVLAVHDQDVFFVGNIETPVLVAVEVDASEVRAKTVGAFRVLSVGVEALEGIILHLKKTTTIRLALVYHRDPTWVQDTFFCKYLRLE